MKARYWLFLILVGAINLQACNREGPFERAGEEVDEAGRAVQDGAERNRE